MGGANARRLVLALFVFTLVAAGLATDTHAQAVEGAMAWGRDNYAYVWQRGGWVRTGYSRQLVSGDRYYHVFRNGQWDRTVDLTSPGWIKILTPFTNTASSGISWFAYPANQAQSDGNTYVLIKWSNQWVSLQEWRTKYVITAQRLPFDPGASIVGGSNQSLPCHNNPACIIGSVR
jgi:hypothetical protein